MKKIIPKWVLDKDDIAHWAYQSGKAACGKELSKKVHDATDETPHCSECEFRKTHPA